MIVKPHTKLRLERWYQVAGDINPAEHGGTWCRELKDGRIEVFEVVPWDWDEPTLFGNFPFEVSERTYDRTDLTNALAEDNVCRFVGVTPSHYDLRKRLDRFDLAASMITYFGGDCRHGFAGDIITPILGRAGGAKAFHKADRAYRRHLREVRK